MNVTTCGLSIPEAIPEHHDSHLCVHCTGQLHFVTAYLGSEKCGKYLRVVSNICHLTQYDVRDNLMRRPILKLPLNTKFLVLHIGNAFHLYGYTFIGLL